MKQNTLKKTATRRKTNTAQIDQIPLLMLKPKTERRKKHQKDKH